MVEGGLAAERLLAVTALEGFVVSVGSLVSLQETTQGETFTADVALVLVSAPLLRLLVRVESHRRVGRLIAGHHRVLGLGEARH